MLINQSLLNPRLEMELPEDFTTFWSTVIMPNVPCKISVPEGVGCFVTNIALDQEDLPEKGRTIVNVSVNNSPVVTVIPFIVGSFESSMTDLQFGSNDRIVFTTKGTQIKVHLCGYLTDGFFFFFDNGAPVEELLPSPDE